MTDERLRNIASTALVLGAMLGMAGTFATTAELRGLLWGIDGIALVLGSALLAMYHLRRGDTLLAAGFLVFLAGEALVLSGSAVDLSASAASFAAGAGLWSASLALVSASPLVPKPFRFTGSVAAMLFALSAAQMFAGGGLTPLSQPFPFIAYPFLASTLVGWAWTHRGSAALRTVART